MVRPAMSRIEPKPAHGPFLRATYAQSRRMYGQLPTPVSVGGHTPLLLAGYGAFELAAERSHHLDARLKALAELKAALVAGCEYCLDIGSMVANRHGVPDEQIRDLADHRSSPHFSALERLVCDYAAAMTRTPVEVTDDHVDALREHLTDAQIVELTTMIALENYRARFNWALGFEPQGFAEGAACPVPAAAAAAAASEASAA
jgi:AhpD family alkylhydroperoxidase